VSEYTHLNPARAGLLDKQNPRLSKYRWSSYPYYLKSPGKRPAWLCVEKVFHELKIYVDNAAGRKKYAQYMDLRVKEVLNPKNKQNFEKEWMDIRRGWYLGNETFKEKLLKLADHVLKGKNRSSFSGETKRMHNERSAEQWVQKAYKIIDMNDSKLLEMKKSDSRKQVIAWLLKEKTSVSNTWIADRLRMGHYTAVNNAVYSVRQGKQQKIKSIHRKIEDVLKLED